MTQQFHVIPLIDIVDSQPPLAVVPVLAGPLQVLVALLPGILLSLLVSLLTLFRPRVMWAGVKLLWRAKYVLVVVVGVIAVAVWQARALWPEAEGVAASRKEQGDDWPLIRGDPARTGAVPGAAAPNAGGLQWSFKPGKAGVYASPAVVGNRVYFSTARTSLFGGGRGEIVCLDADSGAVIWRERPPGYRATFSSPVVSGKRLVCGEGLHTTQDARVICLDLTPGREGDLLWSFRTGSHVECAPVVADGRVYIGAGDDGYYCFDLEAAEDGRPHVVWHADAADYPDAETSLIVDEARVYAGLGRGGRALCVLDAVSGREIQRIETDYPVFSPPAIADGKLYVGMGNGDYVKRAEEIGQKPAGAVWCIDLETLDVVWRYSVGRTVLGSPAVSGGRVYFGSRDGYVYCLTTGGKLVSKWNAHAPILTSPAVTPELVFVVPESGVFYALDCRTLKPQWEQLISTGGLLISSPAVARGRVYVGTEEEGLLCLGRVVKGGETPLWPTRLGGAGRGGNLDDTPLPPLGEFRWQYPQDQDGRTQEVLVAAPPAAWRDRLYAPLAGGDGRRGIVCLPADPDSLDTPEPVWHYETTLPVYRSPAVQDEFVFAVDGQTGDEGRQLHAIDRTKGAARWRTPIGRDASGAFVCTTSKLYVADGGDTLSCFDATGIRAWTRRIGPVPFGPSVAGSLLVVAATNPPRLMGLDAPTGHLLWQARPAGEITAPPVVDKQSIYVGTAGGLSARSLIDGGPLFPPGANGEGVATDLVLRDGTLAYVSTDGKLVFVDGASGELSATVEGALPVAPPFFGRDRWFFFGDDGLLTVDPQQLDNKPKTWADTTWLGRPTTPLVLCRSNLYLGMAGWGLVRWGEGL